MRTRELQPTGHAFVVGSIVVAVLIFTSWTVVEQRRAAPRVIELIAPTGRIHVEIADAANTRAKGLSNRDTLPADGMWLEWSAPGRHPIWMDQMRFALDLVWLDEDGRVLAVIADVPPCVRQPCPTYEPSGTITSVAVLELPAPGAARYGITVGTRISRTNPTSILPR